MADNMGLVNIDPSDYVSPDTINNNFKKLDALGLDYIVEAGYSGEWWYRKWKSGRAECGIDSKQFSAISLTTLGNGTNTYRTQYMTFGAYPFAFSSRPYTSITFEGDLGDSSRGSFVVSQHSTSTTTSPYFFIVDWLQKDMKPMVGIYVCGKYK